MTDSQPTPSSPNWGHIDPTLLRPPLYQHQQETVEFLLETPRSYIASDPGTGKTRSVIEAIQRLRDQGEPHRALVFCPKTIMRPSWVADIQRYSDLTCTIADADHRGNVQDNHDIVIVNHDGVKAVQKMDLSGFTVLVIDESTAFKNRETLRSKSIAQIAQHFPRRILMSGTPNPNTVTDLWHQYFILDDGETLGKSFYRFRAIVGEPKASGQFIKWGDKPGSTEAVSALVAEITIRHKLDDVLDIPSNHLYTIGYDLDAKTRKAYDQFAKEAVLELENEQITAFNAGAKIAKLLQIASGALYDNEHLVKTLSNARYDLILDLIDARQQCLVAFLWKHQRDALIDRLNNIGIKYALIDGSVSEKERSKAVKRFQAGDVQVMLAHPASASHGLTLTKGTTTIWASPTWSSELFTQFNHRIHRAGQTRKTETILIKANDTVDEQVYENLGGKLSAMQILLTLMHLQVKPCLKKPVLN